MTEEIRIGAEILNDEYGDIDPEMFRIKHCENPDGRSEGIRVHYEDGKPAGVLALMGMCLHANGRKYRAAQACDAAVAPAFRGRGVLSKLIRFLESTDAQEDFYIGFPNEKSYPHFLHMGYRTISSLYHYVYAIRPGRLLLGERMSAELVDRCWRRFLRQAHCRLLSEETISEASVCELSEDDFRQINGATSVGFERSAAFYRWKTGYNAAIEFHCLTVRREGVLTAFVLCHIREMLRGKVLVIDDWFSSGDEKTRQRLFRVLLHHVKPPYDLVHVPFVNAQSEDDAFFRGMHFMNACRKPFGRRVCPLIVSDHDVDASFMAHACIRNVDSDVLC